MKTLCLLILSLSLTLTVLNASAQDQALIKRIDSIEKSLYAERRAQREIARAMKGRYHKNYHEVEAMREPNIEKLREEIKAIHKTYGFPGISQVGTATSSQYLNLVAWMRNNLEFKEQVLVSIKAEFDKKNASAVDYAYLYDSVLWAKEKKQAYGSFKYRRLWNKWRVRELINPEQVDERRAAIGLGTMDEQLAAVEKEYQDLKTARKAKKKKK